MGKEQIIVQVNPDSLPSGSDLTVVNAARKSFGKRSTWDYPHKILTYEVGSGGDIDEEVDYSRPELKSSDVSLINFLAKGMTFKDYEEFISKVESINQTYECPYDTEELLWQFRNTPTHIAPFGHCFLSFELKVPVFLARQLVKHKFLRWSEYSRRYITDDVEFYQHEYRQASEDKKQGSGGIHPDSEHWEEVCYLHNVRQLELYNSMVAASVAPEQARGCLPSDLMTSLTWSGSMDAFAEMCKLRLGSDSQKEAQYVAQAVYDVLEEYYPVSAKALVKGAF